MNVSDERAEALVAAVGQAHPHLVDPLEAALVAESLGYTDTRVQRELGFSDTAALGQFVFDRLAHRRLPRGPAASSVPVRLPVASFGDCIGAALVYAVPWVIALAIDALAQASRDASLGPPLGVAAMLSLIVVGGVGLAISWCGHFYVDQQQPDVAFAVAAYMFRLGAVLALAATVVGAGIGLFFELGSLPYIVLWADEFVVLSVAWLACGLLTARGEWWRVPVAFAAGMVVFAGLVLLDRSAGVAQLAAAAAVLAAAVLQLPAVVSTRGAQKTAAVPIPRLTVVLFRMLPWLAYGSIYFALVFLGRLLSNPGATRLAWDLAVTSLLLTIAGVEFAHTRFAHQISAAMQRPANADFEALHRVALQAHLQAMAVTAATFLAVAGIIAAGAHLYNAPFSDRTWTLLIWADAGYLLVAVAMLNAVLLFAVHRPWSAVRAFAAGLALTLILLVLLRPLAEPAYTAAALIAGGAVAVALATRAVRQAWQRPDYAGTFFSA